ncbi:MAG: winged helix DNA-binding protein [Youngiibacter sp.]|nr:winged helix DNA-binding protein [Youngiibacter sp.]
MNSEILGDLIMTIYKNLKTKMERDLKQYDIGMGQMQILIVFFSDVDGIKTQNDLAKQLSVDKGNISRSMVKLLEKGYIEQTADSKKSFRLTEKGIELKLEIIPIFMRINELMTEDIGVKDFDQTVMTLTKISKNLEWII